METLLIQLKTYALRFNSSEFEGIKITSNTNVPFIPPEPTFDIWQLSLTLGKSYSKKKLYIEKETALNMTVSCNNPPLNPKTLHLLFIR